MASNNGSPVTRAELKVELARLRAELIKKCATKKDLAAAFGKCATKKDLAAAFGKCATKKDLDERAGRIERRLDLLTAQVVRNTEDISGIRETVATKADIDRILTVLDEVTGSYKTCWQKLVVHDHRLRDVEERCPPGR